MSVLGFNDDDELFAEQEEDYIPDLGGLSTHAIIEDEHFQQEQVQIEKMSKEMHKEMREDLKMAEKSKEKQTKEYIAALKQKQKEEQQEIEDREKEDIYEKITKYYEYFPSKIKPKKGITINSKVSTLQAELRRCQNSLRSQGCLDNIKKADIMFCWLTERILVSQFDQKVHGLAAEAEKSQHLMEDILKELAIKHESWFSTGPEWRYFVFFMTRIQTVLERNTGVRMSAAYLPTDTDKQNKYKDM